MTHQPNQRGRANRNQFVLIILIAAYVAVITIVLAAAMATTGFAAGPLAAPVPGIP
ncbi:MAG TPA: hypothetical protein VK871_12145 [Candidatus Limnocylindrales bacterium]|nr:hypothetical protein [Candidatus Limnocylindrales bacterium]